MSIAVETPTKQPELPKFADGPPPLPVRMLNEYVYCPRLAYLMWVQGEFSPSADTVEGKIGHRRVDRPGVPLPEAKPAVADAESEADPKAETPEAVHARSVRFTSERLAITGKVDLVEAQGNAATPVDYKRGKRSHTAGGAWNPERVQLCAQGLLALNNGEVQGNDFLRGAGGCALTDGGRKRFIAAFERRMAQEVTHPLFRYRISYRRLLEVQARLLIRWLAGEIPAYPLFLTR